MRIRPLYSACNEDTRSEIRALMPSSEDRVVVIAAGGGRALSLLSTSPRSVIAVDRNLDQIFSLELKASALDGFSYEGFRAFLGVDACGHRLEMYGSIRPALTRSAQGYWDKRLSLIDEGVLYAGRLERGLSQFVARLRRVGLFEWPATLLNVKTLEEQREWVSLNLGSARSSSLYWRFFCNPIAAWVLIQDPSFLRCTEGSLGQYLYGRFLEYTERLLARESFFLHLLYFGKYSANGPLPIYLSREGYDCAKKALDRMTLSCSLIEDILPTVDSSVQTKWSLSDISCWASERRFDAFLTELIGRMSPGDRFCYRNFGACRSIPQQPIPRVKRLDRVIESIERTDTSAFFRFEVGEAVDGF